MWTCSHFAVAWWSFAVCSVVQQFPGRSLPFLPSLLWHFLWRLCCRHGDHEQSTETFQKLPGCVWCQGASCIHGIRKKQSVLTFVSVPVACEGRSFSWNDVPRDQATIPVHISVCEFIAQQSDLATCWKSLDYVSVIEPRHDDKMWFAYPNSDRWTSKTLITRVSRRSLIRLDPLAGGYFPSGPSTRSQDGRAVFRFSLRVQSNQSRDSQTWFQPTVWQCHWS